MSGESSPKRVSESEMESKNATREATSTPSHKASSPNGVRKNESPSNDGSEVSNHVKPSTTKRPSRRTSAQVISDDDDDDDDDEDENVVGGDVTIKMENGKAAKISHSPKKKVKSKKHPKFLDEPDITEQATESFERLSACIYANRNFGITDKFMECDCVSTLSQSDGKNHACDEDSDCINRATKMECVDACNCGSDCQNRRFQNRSYADVSVFKTEKKGYGLRANTDLKSESLIYEYIGEVVGEKAFRSRMAHYDREGIKHFYFMSLNQGEFIDATKKGNLGRFCNHSCNPNCEVVKWIVGDRLRMGIFALRMVEAGEELTFNYNVDRYGADAQKCFCGEPNCKKYIGGKTQTDKVASLSTLTIEALGIGDVDELEDDAPKKPRKQKTGEDDEEYVEQIKPKGLTEHAVEKVMASFLQQKEKWVIAKLLSRLQQCNDEKILGRVVRMHGYKILKVVLTSWVDDKDISLQILDVLHKLPRLTRNKIHDSGIEDSVRTLQEKGDGLVQERAQRILDVWSTLEMGYRIPRIQKDPNAGLERDPRRYRQRSRSPVRTRSKSPELPDIRSVPTGPKGSIPQRKPGMFGNARPPPRRPPGPPPLPEGWAQATSANGKVYFYSMMGHTTWERPTRPVAPPPSPPPVMTEQKYTQRLLEDTQKIVEEEQRLRAEAAARNKQQAASGRSAQAATRSLSNEGHSTAHTSPSSAQKKPAAEKEPYWKKLNTEQRKKVYEKTIAPCLRTVVNEFYKKLDKEKLKEFARQCSKKITESDFKNNRVLNPTDIDARHQHKIRKHAREFFNKAVVKKQEHDERQKRKSHASGTEPNTKDIAASHSMSPMTSPPPLGAVAAMRRDSLNISSEDVTENGKDFSESPSTGSKRKRDVEETPLSSRTPGDEEASPAKKPRSLTPLTKQNIPPPPPSPPPPSAGAKVDKDGDSPMRDEEEEYSPMLEDSEKTNGPCDQNSPISKVPPGEVSGVDSAAERGPHLTHKG
ncbi:MAG: histone methyltransferase set2 [Alyxoria varia]|nr:MAG: histone methyltransferase set2 [Alyxoria varia]